MARRTEMRLLCLILLSANIVVAQSPQPRKDIPTIAKSARGAIVTIVMENDDKPIARGTGFLVSTDGAIMTNYHVIATGNVAVVKFADGTVLPVDGVLATDKFHDLAVLKIHGKTFQTLTLGNSDQLQVGEEVVAIGNPLGLELTVSNGIVSGIRTDEEDKLLQITAPISRGSSGGPLFNMSGEVVGINALILEGGESLNFAIPINDAQRLLSEKVAKLQDLPNETERVKSETRHEPVKPETKHVEATPSFSKSSLKDTLQWMRNSLRDEGTSHLPEGGTFSAELTDFSGCRVHFTVRVEGAGGGSGEYLFNLNDIDPTTAVFHRFSEAKPETPVKPGEEDLGGFGASTTNKRNSVKSTMTEEHENVSEIVFMFGYPGYGDQFAEAFRHSVNLCGGKPSILPPPPSYYVRSNEHGTYIIEYGGRQMAATCRETLSWPDGIDKPGQLMGEHDCTYMWMLVGKHISPELMWRQDKELRYQPWVGHDTAQTADILDITAEAPVGALLRKPSPKTSPETLKALHWIQNTLADGEGRTVSSETLARDSRLDEVNGCQVTFVYYQIGSDNKMTGHSRSQVNLGDLDPASLTVGDDYENKHIDIVGPVRIVTVHTTDKVPGVHFEPNDWGWQSGFATQSTDLLWQLPAPYAARFAKALKQAITLCGGKSSSF